MPTDQQIENARRAGWDVGAPGDADYPKAPPGGWDVHGAPVGDDIVDAMQARGENEAHNG